MGALTLVLAFIWDQIFGDPQHWPHPVRWMGNLIQKVEAKGNQAHFSPKIRKFNGLLLCLGLVLGVFISIDLLLLALNLIHPLLSLILSVLLLGVALATHDLPRAALEIERYLASGDLEMARAKLAWIVGRDTQTLSPSEIRRACIETLAENFTDAVLSPIFWFVLLGPAGCWALKAASTLDSMIAYRNERYEHFGYFSAKLDDAMHFIPARLGAWVLIPLSAALGPYRFGECLQCVWKDRLKHPSPNSAHSEAAFAGALGLRLGGPSHYQGRISQKPFLNAKGKTVFEPRDLHRAVQLLHICTLVSVLGGASVLLFWKQVL